MGLKFREKNPGKKFREKIHCDGIVCALNKKKTYQSIHLTFQKKMKKKNVVFLKKYLVNKKNENKSLLCLFRVPFVVMRIIFTTKYIFFVLMNKKKFFLYILNITLYCKYDFCLISKVF